MDSERLSNISLKSLETGRRNQIPDRLGLAQV